MAQGLYRLQVVFNRNSGVSEDVAVIDLGMAHVTGSSQSTFAAIGALDDSYPGLSAASGTDLTNITGDVQTLVTALLTKMGTVATPAYVKVIRMDSGHPTPNAPVSQVTLTGTAAGAKTCPPQTAASVSLHTANRRRWGRFYVPCLDDAGTTNAGRLSSTLVTSLRDSYTNFASAAAGHNFYPVVFAHQATNGACYSVQLVKVDDIADVIRRRRYDAYINYAQHTFL